jgi:hypothetical protein
MKRRYRKVPLFLFRIKYSKGHPELVSGSLKMFVPAYGMQKQVQHDLFGILFTYPPHPKQNQ